jgi:surface protein
MFGFGAPPQSFPHRSLQLSHLSFATLLIYFLAMGKIIVVCLILILALVSVQHVSALDPAPCAPDCSSYFASGNYSSSINLTDWDTSAVTDMSRMFQGAADFDQYIGNWDVSRVTNMDLMFSGTSIFNKTIANWNVSAVTSMKAMFDNARFFNHPLDTWNVSSVTNMEIMFASAFSFNQPLASWDMRKVTNIDYMFSISGFNQPIQSWDTRSIRSMNAVFAAARFFNQPLANWNVSSVTSMTSLFQEASVFNQPLGNWNLSKVTSMQTMFYDATSFNQPIANWDVGRVTSMQGMFRNAISFNQPIGDWVVTSVTSMDQMFRNASSFSQNLSCWCVPSIPAAPDRFNQSSGLSNFNLPIWGACPCYAAPSAPPVARQPTSPPIISCGSATPPPGAFNISCVNGILYYYISASDFFAGGANLPPNVVITLVGNATISGVYLTIQTIPGTTKGSIIVADCISLSGQIQIQLNGTSDIVDKQRLDFLRLERPDCFVDELNSTVQVIVPGSDCRKVSATKQRSQEPSGSVTISVLFAVDTSACAAAPSDESKTVSGALIGGVVAAAVVVIVAAGFVVFWIYRRRLHRDKEKERSKELTPIE